MIVGLPRPSALFVKVVQSMGLMLGAVAVFMVAGLPVFLIVWAVVLGLFLFSRLSRKAAVFASWSWPQFLATIGFGLGLPYAILLVTAGF